MDFLGRVTMPGKYPKEVAEIKKEVRSALEKYFPPEQVLVKVEKAAVSKKPSNHFVIVVGAGHQNAAGRRLLGGTFLNHHKLAQKPPGWYECEVKYISLISIAPGKPRCKSNGRGKPKLCEPDLAASLQLLMHKSPSKLLVAWGYLDRPNNKPRTCARVDTAVRLGIAKYRFKLRGSKRFERYKKSTGANRASNDEAE
jgi:hypothetical protein